MITVAGIERHDAKTPMSAIRLRCLDCCMDSAHEVALCPVEDCPLWTRRFGKNPNARKLSEEEKAKSSERMKKIWAEKRAQNGKE